MKNELPDGWEYLKLSEVTESINAGGTPRRNVQEYWADGTIPWIKISDLRNVFITDSEEKITEQALSNSSTKIFPPGTVLYSIFATIGATAILQISATTNQAIAGLIPDTSKIDTKYLYYCLQAEKQKITAKKSHSTQDNINLSILRNHTIPVPPLETQHKIVSTLEKAEETKKLRVQADELTQQLLQSVFLKMFGDPVTNPNGWKTKKLKDLAEIVSGVTKGRKLAGKTTVFVPYLRVANVQDGYLDLTEIKQIEVLPSDVDKFQLIDGDVLLTEGGDPDKLGRGAVWHSEIETCIHQNHIFRVRVNQEYLVSEYLSMLTGSSYGKRYFLKSAKQTTGIASINSTQLKNFPAQLPPLELQYHFAEIVNQLEKTKHFQQQSSTEIDTLFNALMQKAFNGELVAE